MKHLLSINEYNVNKTYLYHTTSINNLYDILNSNILKKSDTFNNISFSRNKNYWYKTKRGVRLVLDRELLTQNYKIYPFDYYNDKNYKDEDFIYDTQKKYLPKSALGIKTKNDSDRKTPFEYEECIFNDIKNLTKYIVAIEIDDKAYNKSYIKDYLNEFLQKNPHIKIKIVSREQLDDFTIKYLTESIEYVNSFYELFGNLVYVNNIQRWGDEVKVEYETQDGVLNNYIGDERDFREDFLETNKSFEFKNKKDKTRLKDKPKNVTNHIIKPLQKYNLVFYIGNKNMGIVKRDLTAKLAYALKNTYSKYPEYRSGRLEVEKIK
jgi:hypothetical protein